MCKNIVNIKWKDVEKINSNSSAIFTRQHVLHTTDMNQTGGNGYVCPTDMNQTTGGNGYVSHWYEPDWG